jgi:hypothetical protein
MTDSGRVLPEVVVFDREAEAVAMTLAGERVGPLTCEVCNRPCFATLGKLCWQCVGAALASDETKEQER